MIGPLGSLPATPAVQASSAPPQLRQEQVANPDQATLGSQPLQTQSQPALIQQQPSTPPSAPAPVVQKVPAGAALVPSTLFVEPTTTQTAPLLESQGWSLDKLGAQSVTRATMKALVEALSHDQPPPQAGYLLTGDSGSGKTTLARAVAGELHAQGIPVLAATGAEFSLSQPGDGRGTGADRMRGLFADAVRQAQASPHKSAVVFIDDIEACTRVRTNAPSEVNTQATILTDAFTTQAKQAEARTDCKIVVIGATSAKGNMDLEALTPFPPATEVINPRDRNERFEVLQALDKRNHYPFGPDKDELLKDLASATGGQTPLQLVNLLDAGVRQAKSHGHATLAMADLREARLEAIFGPAQAVNTPDWMFRIAASHELGHAVVRHLMEDIANQDQRPDHLPQAIDCLSFAPRGQANASVFLKPVLKPSGNPTSSFEYYMGEIASNYGGRAAEAIFGKGQVSAGPGNDIFNATSLIHEMVRKKGMGQATGAREVDYNATTDQAALDDEKRLGDAAEHLAMTAVSFYRDYIGNLAGDLLARRNSDPEELVLTGADFEKGITAWEQSSPERQEAAQRLQDYTRRLLDGLRPHLKEIYDPVSGHMLTVEDVAKTVPDAFKAGPQADAKPTS